MYRTHKSQGDDETLYKVLAIVDIVLSFQEWERFKIN